MGYNLLYHSVHDSSKNIDIILEDPPCAHSWISRNTDLKYSKYYRFLMLESSHVRFALEIE